MAVPYRGTGGRAAAPAGNLDVGQRQVFVQAQPRLGQRVAVAQALDALVHAVVVEADAFLHRLVHAQPVALLETALGFAAGLAEQGVVLVEALDHGQGDLVRVGAVKADGYFHGRERQGSARNSSTGE